VSEYSGAPRELSHKVIQTPPTSVTETVIVTGAAGYLGRKLVRTVLDNTLAQVIGIDKEAIDDYADERLRFIKCDLSTDEGEQSIRRLGATLQDSVIFHLAGLFVKDVRLAPYVAPVEYEKDNVVATRRLVEAVLNSGYRPRLFAFSSTACVYDGATTHPTPVEIVTPIFPYAESKLEAEQEIRKLVGWVGQVVILRFARVIGLGEGPTLPQDIVSDFIERIVKADRRQTQCSIGSVAEVRPYIHIDDLMSVLLRLLKDYRGEGLVVKNVTSAGPIQIEKVAGIVAETLAGQGLLWQRPDLKLLSTQDIKSPILLNPLPNGKFNPRHTASADVVQLVAEQYCTALKKAIEAESEQDVLSAVEKMRAQAFSSQD
jgi:nucleoside-diphosphate-sugar epimerase